MLNLLRGIDLRLRKLEGPRRVGVFFLAWGRDDAEIVGKLDEAKAAGMVGCQRIGCSILTS